MTKENFTKLSNSLDELKKNFQNIKIKKGRLYILKFKTKLIPLRYSKIKKLRAGYEQVIKKLLFISKSSDPKLPARSQFSVLLKKKIFSISLLIKKKQDIL